jgi:hypothetical protein
MLYIVILFGIMLILIRLNIVMLHVFMLGVMAPLEVVCFYRYSDRRYAECRHDLAGLRVAKMKKKSWDVKVLVTSKKSSNKGGC